MQNNTLMSFNKEAAEKAGSGGKLVSGKYVGIMQAITTVAGTGSAGVELSLHGEHDFEYISVYYAKEDGTEISGGKNHLNAIMGLLQINHITTSLGNIEQKQVEFVNEFMNKKIGMVLQRRNYVVKTGENAGNVGWSWDLRMAFDAQTGQTAQEKLNNLAPTAVAKILETLQDEDGDGVAEARVRLAQGNAAQDYGRPTSKFDQLSNSGGFQQQQGGFQQQQQAPAQQGGFQQQQGGFQQQQQAPAQQGGFQQQQQAPAQQGGYDLNASDDEFFRT